MTYTYGGSTSGYVNTTGVNLLTSYNVLGGATGYNDTLTGGVLNDYIDGKAGDDLLVGNDGLDVLQGSAGADTYVFQVNRGYDTVKNFEASADKIRISSYLGSTGYNYSDLSFIPQNGGTSIVLQGTTTVWMHLDGFTGPLSAANFS
jgi:Ca2+-binding RTX toxin-like protein